MEVGKPIKDSSLRPPAHGRDVHKKSRRGRPPPWALLDKTAYFADICNATSKTREGHEIPRMTLPVSPRSSPLTTTSSSSASPSAMVTVTIYSSPMVARHRSRASPIPAATSTASFLTTTSASSVATTR
ncbi:Os09g0569500 [Oryza sativa Japonica Group]|uniref:Os09g0569500 protein n=1 Tax=Oryza sativa subsp. japonica TaxID=39947 RepID=A0A0P0XR92_ORYSJ|nr:Os09g0569500 [Oryza sativa Japonica Group]